MSFSNYVYAMSGRHGAIKIGMTSSPLVRLKALQNGYDGSLRIIGLWQRDDAGDIEGKAHRKLWAWRLHGEWFKITPTQAFEAVMSAILETDAPKQVKPKVAQMPPPVLLPADSHRLGYARSFCRTPLDQQREWLLANKVDERDIFQDLTRTKSFQREAAYKDLRQGDTFLAWSPDVIGSDEDVAMLMHLAESRGARVMFAKPWSEDHVSN